MDHQTATANKQIEYQRYYVPTQSPWPILGAIGMGLVMVGVALIFHNNPYAWYIFGAGSLIMAGVLYGWFYNVIHENQANLYSPQMHRSFRMSMMWFIFTEVMFFGCFFGALFYARFLAISWLGGFGDRGTSHLLWQNFTSTWPLLVNPNPTQFVGPTEAMGPWPLPTINTAILLTSGITVTIAHHALLKNKRPILIAGLFATFSLGLLFLVIQAYEYYHAYHAMGLTLNSGIYGTTFFILTGFHGAHVAIGSFMLIIMFLRSLKGHFTPANHFAFEATAWYWHFVDIVWLFLYVLVYWL